MKFPMVRKIEFEDAFAFLGFCGFVFIPGIYLMLYGFLHEWKSVEEIVLTVSIEGALFLWSIMYLIIRRNTLDCVGKPLAGITFVWSGLGLISIGLKFLIVALFW